MERMQEMLTLIGNLDNQIIILGNHVSNALAFNALLPRDKRAVMEMLEQAINDFDEDKHRKRRQMLRNI